MKNFTNIIAILALTFTIAATLTFAAPASQDSAQDALQRGYRTGYSDGYMAGYRDVADAIEKNPTKHPEYDRADRAFSVNYGSIEDYKDGYRQGFESGYSAGYDKQPFNPTVPETLARRGAGPNPIATPSQADGPGDAKVSEQEVVIIPKDSMLILEMIDEVSTESSKVGDKFRAKVVSPIGLTGMTVEGRVTKVSKAGRVRRRAEMVLAFDRIIVSESRWGNMSAILTEVLPVKGDNVSKVDREGTVEGKVLTKGDAAKLAVVVGTGAIVGNIVSGPAGAAVGAVVGAGAAAATKGRDIRLNRLQQLRIRTSIETKIR